MRNPTLTLILSLAISGAMGQSKHYKNIDTLTIYKNGDRRIVIGKKVTHLKSGYTISADNVKVCNYYISTGNIIQKRNIKITNQLWKQYYMQYTIIITYNYMQY